jgi:hypothetical protein
VSGTFVVLFDKQPPVEMTQAEVEMCAEAMKCDVATYLDLYEQEFGERPVIVAELTRSSPVTPP